MTENDLYVWLEGYNERQDLERDIMRNIMWSSIMPHSKKKLKPSDLVPLESDKKRTLALAEKMSKEEYLIKKEQIERLWKKKTNT